MTSVQFEQRVRECLDRSVVAFNNGEAEFFNELADDAMIVLSGSAEPVQGREAYRQRGQASPGSRQKTILTRNVQVIENKAVVTQTASVKQGTASSDVLQTLVFGQSGDGVKVLHLHNAVLAAKSQQEDGSARRPVQVVNERIATIASVSGVAQ